MKIKIVLGTISPFPYGGSKEFVRSNVENAFEAERTCINYYTTKCGHSVYIYNANEVKEMIDIDDLVAEFEQDPVQKHYMDLVRKEFDEKKASMSEDEWHDYILSHFVNVEELQQKCCNGGPQWGHAWDCPKCPD